VIKESGMESRKQKEIDFSRAEQLAILTAAVLKPAVVIETSAQKKVSAQVQKSVLRWIDDFGRGREAWPSLDTLARTANMGRRHLIRALKALTGSGLLIVERGDGTNGRRRDCNYYRIVWSELALLTGRYGCKQPAPADTHMKPASAGSDEGDSFDLTGGAPASSMRRRRPPSERSVVPHASQADDSFGSAPGTVGSAPGTVGSAPGAAGSAPGTPEAFRSVQETKPPPTSSSALRALPREAFWDEVEEGLFSAGILQAAEVVRDARDRRIAPQSILALIRIYTAQPDRWRGPGALYYRATRFRAGQSPEDLSLWPPASKEYLARQRHVRPSTIVAQVERDKAAARDEAERLERDHGAALDAMDVCEFDELVARLAPFTRRHFAADLRNHPVASGMARAMLLDEMDSAARIAREEGR
jgi:AraC-like DNA-binding protein